MTKCRSIPSKNAEPIKQWLARLGIERIDETFDPSITVQRAIDTYRAKATRNLNNEMDETVKDFYNTKKSIEKDDFDISI